MVNMVRLRMPVNDGEVNHYVKKVISSDMKFGVPSVWTKAATNAHRIQELKNEVQL